MKFGVFSVSMPEYDIGQTVSVLKELGYNGYLSIEDFSNEADTLSKLKSNLEFLKNI